MDAHAPLEVEIKVKVEGLEALPSRLEALGFSCTAGMQVEKSVLWDREDELRSRGEALRVRLYGGEVRITWKGARHPDARLKIRPEVETSVASEVAFGAILQALGYRPVFEMVKERATYEREGLLVCLDRTPFGCFVEVEGPTAAIEATLAALGLAEAPVETRSYPTLFRIWQGA